MADEIDVRNNFFSTLSPIPPFPVRFWKTVLFNTWVNNYFYTAANGGIGDSVEKKLFLNSYLSGVMKESKMEW